MNKSVLKPAILYLRYSDHSQDGGTTIETQEKICRNACEAQGYEVVDVVKNEAVSADHKKQTRRVADLLEFCKERKGKFEILMVFKTDRFARSQQEHHWLRGELLRMGVLLRSATEKIDETPAGKLTEGVLAAVNEYDNEVRRERCKLGMWRRVEQGLWPWKPPAGYMSDPNRPTKVKLSAHVFDHACSDIIRDIFAQYSTGLVSKVELARQFSKRKIQKHNGVKIKFSKQSIDWIINNQYYVGLLKHEDGRLIEGHHQKLINSKVFNKCQDVQVGKSNLNTGKRKRFNPDFPLRQFTQCGFCSEPFTGAKAKRKYYHYFCYNPDCINFRKTIRKSDLENNFGNYLAQIKPSENLIKRFTKIFIKRYEQREQEIRGDYLRQVDGIKKMEKEKKWIIKNGKQGILTGDTLKEELQDIERRITLSKMELTEIHGEELDINALLAYAYDFIRTAEKTWIDAPFEQKLKLQRLIFPDGIKYKLGEFSNSKISPLFSLIETIGAKKVSNVDSPGIEPGIYPCEGYGIPFTYEP